jgi:hypothetical protein
METNVKSRAGLDGRGSDPQARGKGELAAEDRWDMKVCSGSGSSAA